MIMSDDHSCMHDMAEEQYTVAMANWLDDLIIWSCFTHLPPITSYLPLPVQQNATTLTWQCPGSKMEQP